MLTKTIRYDPESGWEGSFPAWDSPSTLVLLFGESQYIDQPGPFRQLREELPRSHVVGCSTAGQIVGDSIRDGGLVATFARFDRATIRVASSDKECRNDPHAAGRSIASVLSSPGLRGVFVLSDGTSMNGTLLATGLREGLPEGVCATGGLAGDGKRFERTWVCCDSDPQGGIVAAIGIYGDQEAVGFWHGCKGGWDTFGPERVVTKSRDNRLYELDGRPALSLYEQYLGDQAAELPASALLFPLALRRADESQTLVRTVLNVSREDHSMIFAGDIPEGAVVQLMQANFDRIIDGAAQAASMLSVQAMEGRDLLSIAISCVGRRLILRHRAEEELEEVLACLPQDVTQTGFYSYGELSPLVGSTCELHNQTMTLTVISETR